jgi:integrase
MARGINKLSAVSLTKLPPGMHGDGGGLWLQVTPGGRSWIFRYTFNGHAREMGLGSFNTFSLADAREEARKCRKLLAGSLPDVQPVDPIEHRRKMLAEARVEAAKALTFKTCAERCIAAHKAGWRNEKHAAQWPATLEAYVYPLFGALPVQAADVGLVMKAIEPIWLTKPETASRVRGRIESVLDYATARGWRRGENPARWRGHLDQVLSRPSTAKRVAREASGRGEHHPAMPFDKLPAFVAELRTREALSARSLDFTILTAMRTETVLGAKWPEIDRAQRMWTIPAGRPGLKRPGDYRVPLSDAALAVLDAVGWPESGKPSGKGYIFPGAKPGRPLSNMAMLKLLQKRMGYPQFTVHGFRSTFSDWAAERTNFPREVVEMALAHTVADKVEKAYRRGDLFEKRRELMRAWEAYCANEQASSKIVSLMGRA